MRQLDELDTRKVALLAAPGGMGKSELIRTWLRSTPARDERHVQVILMPGLKERTNDPLRRALAEFRGDDLIYIVVDRHEIAENDRFLHEIVDIAESDPRYRLIFAGRTRPPVPLTSIALHGHLLEITALDLRLTPAEQRELLERCTPGISAELLHRIDEDYNGWPIALELLSNQPSTPAKLDATRNLIDSYLEEEVLADICEDDLALLRALSALDEFTPLAANFLGQRADAGARLTHLAAHGLPLEWLDNGAIRFNPALRAYLTARLAADSARQSTVNRRAAQWLQRTGEPEHAIRHAIAAEDLPLTYDLVAQYLITRLTTLTPHEQEFLRTLTRLVPDAPALQLAQLTILTFTNTDAEPMAALAALEADILAGDEVDQARFHAAALALGRTHNYQRHTDLIVRAVAFAQDTLDGRHAGLGQMEQAVVLSGYGTYLRMTGNHHRAEPALQHAIATARLSNLNWLGTWCTAQLAHVHALLGRCTSALRLAEDVLGEGQSAAPHLPLLEPAHLAVATVALDRGELDAAAAAVQRAWEVNEAAGVNPRPFTTSLDAQIRTARGDARSALRVLQDYQMVNPPLTAYQRGQLAYSRAMTHIALNMTGQAESDLVTMRSSLPGLQGPTWAAILRARMLMSQGQPTQALDEIEPFVSRRQDIASDKAWLHVLMAYGVACSAAGRHDESLSAFQRAGVLAETMGVNTPNAKHTQFASAMRPEELNLTHAERNVLAHLATGAPLGAISEELYISPNTLKTHLRRIYRKLGVTGRQEAVSRARGLGIRGPSA